jgi:hypothetical protein
VSDAERAYETGPAESPYHRGLPIGERVSAEPLTGSPFFGFDGDIAVKPLEPMLVPERPRLGAEAQAQAQAPELPTRH